MAAELYVRRSTALHRLHPVTKLVGLLVLLAAPFCVNHPMYALPLLALAATAALAAGGGPTLLRLKWLISAFLLLSLVLWSLFERQGEPLFRLAGLTITRRGFLFGLTVGIRLNTFLLAAVAMLSCTPNEDVVFALGRLGLPYPFAFALSLSFRLVPLFMETVETVTLAQRARGLDLESGGLLTRSRRYVPILLPVLFLSILRTNQLTMALESKGFGPRIKRTRMVEHHLGKGDALAIVTLVALAGAATTALLLGIGQL